MCRKESPASVTRRFAEMVGNGLFEVAFENASELVCRFEVQLFGESGDVALAVRELVENALHPNPLDFPTEADAPNLAESLFQQPQ